MTLTQTLFAALTVILFFIGLWPIAFISLAVLVIMTLIKNYKPGKTNLEKKLEQRIQELEGENKKLRQDLDQQFIQDIINKTTSK